MCSGLEVDVSVGHLRSEKTNKQTKKIQLLKCTEQKEQREVHDKTGGSKWGKATESFI